MAATKVHSSFTKLAWADLQAVFDNSTQGNPTGVATVASSIAAGDAIRLIDATINSKIAVMPRLDERTGLRTPDATFAGLRNADFTISAYLNPSGAAGTAPDIGALITAAMGTETIVGGTSVTYTLSGDESNEITQFVVLLLEHDPDHTEYLVNGVITSMTITPVNGEATLIEFVGVSAVGAEIRFAQVTAAGPSTTVDVTDATFLKNLRPWVGNLIEFYDETTGATDDNTGAGYTLSAVPNAGTSFTVAPAVTTTNQSRVRSFNPTRTLAADTVPSGPAGTQIDSASAPLTSATIALNDLNVALSEAGFWGVSRGYRRMPNIETTLDFISDSEHDTLVSRMKHGAPFDEVEFAVVFDLFNGLFTTDGNRCRITMPKIVPVGDVSESDNEGEARTVTVTGQAWNSDGASSNDVISIAFV